MQSLGANAVCNIALFKAPCITCLEMTLFRDNRSIIYHFKIRIMKIIYYVTYSSLLLVSGVIFQTDIFFECPEEPKKTYLF